MKKWTFDDIPDQKNRIALVTGANSGLGFQTSLMLAKNGAEVILACRNQESADKSIKAILSDFPGAKVSSVKLDLSDLDSVASCVNTIKGKYSHLDLLINNAGVMVPPFSRTKQGFELQFGTNHLGHFALTGGLLPLLKDTQGARIISLSSIAASLNYIDLNDLNYEHKRYHKWLAYGQSKLADQLFILELAERLKKSNSKAIAVAAHPGVSSTNLFKSTSYFVRKIGMAIVSQSPENGALPTLRAACDPNVRNGSYWGPSGLLKFKGDPVETRKDSKAKDPAIRKELWDLSEKLTGTHYPF